MWSPKRQLGNIGENVTSLFLTKHGFEILDRNYLRKWGEIDIVARKGKWIHFVEVKSVSHVTTFRPEENMHPHKLKRLHRAIQTYLMEKKLDCDWQLDLALVRINETDRTAQVEMLENIV